MSNANAQVGSERPGVAGAVYAMTNDASENRVLVYRRNSKGLLTFHRPVLTHGRGSGGVLDPLQSQGSLALSEDDKFLFVANAGSGTISSFRVVPSGLAFVDQTNSGGAQPLSIAIDGDLLYVLNNASITGFRILHDGRLSAVPASTRFLAAILARDLGASDIAFSPNGSFLVLTERLANQIVVFPVEADGVTGTPVDNNSHGNTPFSCAFTPSGVLIVAEFAGGPDGGAAASSYTIAMDGTLQLISGSVPTQGTAACWNVVTPDGKACVVTNAGSCTETLFSVSEAGELSFVNVTSAGPNTTPIDTALTPDGLFLYTLNAEAGSISAYRLDESSRTLTLLGSVSDGLTGSSGLNGLAAR
jgi:6-phosphogluconolactonase